MSPAKTSRRPAKGTGRKTSQLLTDEERAAMKELAQERRRGNNTDGEKDVLEKIAAMQKPDRVMAERLHKLVKDTAPNLTPKTWYGMPAYARDGKIVCFFQSAQKFKSRYATLGFSDNANLDHDGMWPTSFALAKLGPAEEKKVVALVKQAVS